MDHSIIDDCDEECESLFVFSNDLQDLASNEHGDAIKRLGDRTIAVGASKRPRSPMSDEDGDEYEKRTRIDYDSLPWNEAVRPNNQASDSMGDSENAKT